MPENVLIDVIKTKIYLDIKLTKKNIRDIKATVQETTGYYPSCPEKSSFLVSLKKLKEYEVINNYEVIKDNEDSKVKQLRMIQKTTSQRSH